MNAWGDVKSLISDDPNLSINDLVEVDDFMKNSKYITYLIEKEA